MSDQNLAVIEKKPGPLGSPAFARFFKIWLISLVVLFAFQTLFPTKPKPVEAAGEISVKVTNGNNLSVPHLPALTILNATASGITMDTCKDLVIRRNGAVIDPATYPVGFCKTVLVAGSGGTYSLAEADKGDLVVLAPLFRVPGEVEFSLSVAGKQFTEKVVLSQPGVFKSFFLSVFYEPIYNLFVFLIDHIPGKNLGWAIVILTIIVRIILLYPQHHMLVANRKMQAIQPKIKELQTKHKDDQQAMGMALMKLYKEEKANPLGSCLPLLIQTPILIMLYWAILEIDHVVNTFYLYSFVGSFDPTTIDTQFFGLNLTSSHTMGSLILAVVSAIAQFIQVKLSQSFNKKPEISATSKNPNMPDMAQMMKVMIYMIPLMVGVSTYMFPAGVGVYWFVGTVFVTLQQIVVNQWGKAKEKKVA